MKKTLILLLLAILGMPQVMRAADDTETASITVGYCQEECATSMALGGARRESIVAVRFDEDFVKRYAGCDVKAIRVCFGNIVGKTAGVWLDEERPDEIPYMTDPNDAKSDDYYKAAAGKPQDFAFHFPYEEWIDVSAGQALARQWVEIPLSKSYRIKGDQAFLAGFRTFPAPGSTSNSLIALASGGTEEHSWVYFPDSEDHWAQLLQTNMAEFGVNLMIQVVIEGSDLPVNDIAMAAVNGSDFLKIGEEYRYECVMQNKATNIVKSFDLSYSIDGKEVMTNKTMNFQNGLKYNEYGGFVIDNISFTEPGMHHITVTVSNPNGVEDTNPKDNVITKSVNVYDPANSVDRRVLVESFSTASCGNCPGAHEREREAFDGTDVIEVCHHSGFNTDPFTTKTDTELLWFYNMGGSTFAPAIMMDRTSVNSFYDTGYPGPIFLPGAPNDLRTIAETLKDVPSTVGVEIAGEYNPETRELSVDISGSVLAFPTGSDHRINVWLVEDNLKCKQPQSGSSEGANYIHRNVFRETLTGVWGEQINLKSTSYAKNYTFTIPAAWNPDNVKVVAFLANITIDDPTNCKVFNAQEIKLSELIPSSIAQLSVGQPSTTTYYNLAGQRTTSNAEGVNIRRSIMPSGEVVARKMVK